MTSEIQITITRPGHGGKGPHDVYVSAILEVTDEPFCRDKFSSLELIDDDGDACTFFDLIEDGRAWAWEWDTRQVK